MRPGDSLAGLWHTTFSTFDPRARVGRWVWGTAVPARGYRRTARAVADRLRAGRGAPVNLCRSLAHLSNSQARVDTGVVLETPDLTVAVDEGGCLQILEYVWLFQAFQAG